jgi:GTP-dependent phosphoenolpyruvate carboxykinase
LDISGLDMDTTEVDALLEVNVDEWITELNLIASHYEGLGERLPEEMTRQLERLSQRLKAAAKD